MACGILVPQPGPEPTPSAVKVQSPNLWTTREFPQPQLLFNIIYKEYIWKTNIFLFRFTQIFFYQQEKKPKNHEKLSC